MISMYDNTLIYLFIGALVCTVGAVPFGLVNLSVVNVAVTSNIRKSMSIAFGAAIIEIVFALAALFAGTLLQNVLNGSVWIKIIISGVLFSAGVFFWFRKSGEVSQKTNRNLNGFLKGVLLNFISIQVLLFWIVAVTFLSVRNIIPTSFVQVFLFIIGVWIAKMTVLRVYAILAKKVIEKSQMLSQNINRIMGVMLIIIAFIQLLKF